MIAPCDVWTIEKEDGVTDMKQMEIQLLPPRFVAVDLDLEL